MNSKPTNGKYISYWLTQALVGILESVHSSIHLVVYHDGDIGDATIDRLLRGVVFR